MTDEELIKAQADDISKLVKVIRARDEQILARDNKIKDLYNKLNNKPYERNRDYFYKVPYFRIDSYGIRVYALINVDECCWESGNVYTTYRFTDLFGFRLDDGDFGALTSGWGGRRSFSTCITHEVLMKKLDRRVKLNYKGRGSEYAKLISNLQKELVKYQNWFSNFFADVEEEEDNNG